MPDVPGAPVGAPAVPDVPGAPVGAPAVSPSRPAVSSLAEAVSLSRPAVSPLAEPPRPLGAPASPWRARLDGLADVLGTTPLRLLAGAAVVVALGAWLLASTMAGAGGEALPLEDSLPRAQPAPGPAPAAESTIVVQAAGAVASPGVYRLPAGSRVADLLAAAGGARPDADGDQLHLAAVLADGQRVYVPRKGEVLPAPTPTAADGQPAGPVDLNTATVDQLDDLPGIGPATAKAIVDWRTKHGRFRSVEQLLQVRGIGTAKLDALRDKVRVS